MSLVIARLRPARLSSSLVSSRSFSSSITLRNFDHSYDVVVVGSGCSGLTTSVVCAKNGLKVLVVEKTRYFGGTTAYSGGGAWIPNNKHQPAIGVSDSAEDAAKYLHSVLGDAFDKTKVPAYIESAPKMVEWVEQNTEMKFKPVPLPDYHPTKPGASVGRTILTTEFNGRKLGNRIKQVRYPIQGYSAFGTMQADPAELVYLTNPFGSVSNLVKSATRALGYVADLVRFGKGAYMCNGNAIVGSLMYTALDLGVDIWNFTPAVAPILDNGRVTGIEVVHDGVLQRIEARKGVVLASGGFGRSPEARTVVPHEWCACPSGNTGDGKRIGLESGGALPPKNVDNAIFAPISLHTPSKGPIRRFPHFAIDRSKPGSIIVGPDGKRFVNESLPYQEFVKTMHERKIKKAFYIGDKHYLRKYGMGMALPWPYPIGSLKRSGYLISAPSIAELAEKIGVPASTLSDTVATMNKYAETGKDAEFGRGDNVYDQFYGDASTKLPNPNLGKCESGPFYALPLYPGNVSVLYGLQTSIDAEVLSKDDTSKPVPGLFAVGLDQNTVFKGAYPGGGSSIGPGMTFGYRAGLKLSQA
ncbi:FAD binding domain-containing protein [Myxozyma melibiosi]|uniref:FAD binding domain-containing protein n=1 Tax=Myxozyma melibiosi TaxID=54550 RepID=A0ABR1EZK4_9ASCO